MQGQPDAGSWRRVAAGCAAVIVAAAASLLVLPAALGYDAEAWLVWGRELTTGSLDVTAGPAVKPLPMLWNAVAVWALGDALGWQVWAAAARAGLLAAAVLAAVAVRRAGGSAAWQAAGAGVVVATPTLLAGALTGAAEAIATAGLIAAALLAADRRATAATAALGGVALLRPEALVLIAGLLAWTVTRGPARGRRGAAVVAAGTGAVVLASWVGLQLAGGGALRGGVQAATALREGQPGLAARPWLAALTEVTAAVPWLALAALGVGGFATASARRRAPAGVGGPDARPRTDPTGWLVAFGGTWVVTVVAMAELGFSGEARYLAPGVALLAVAGVGWVGVRVTSPAASLAVAGVVVVSTLLPAHAAVVDQRRLRDAQQELDGLLARVGLPVVRRCEATGVPRFLRPPVAWRAGRPISSLQSPSLVGTSCALRRGAARASVVDDGGRRVIARHGRWSWWAEPEQAAES